jgi:hypothetical protein
MPCCKPEDTAKNLKGVEMLDNAIDHPAGRKRRKERGCAESLSVRQEPTTRQHGALITGMKTCVIH